MEDNLLIEQRGAVLWLILNRPAAMNALTPAMIAALDGGIARAGDDESVRCVVITGVGRAFCAGADLNTVRQEFGKDERALGRFLAVASGAMTRIETLAKPVIAAVNGFAFAGGLEIVLACDLVVASEQATFGDAHSNYGLLPGGGSSVRLPRKVGVNRAKYMLLSGELVSASELLGCGFVHQVVASELLNEAAERLAGRIVTKSPLVMRRLKQLVDAGLDQPTATALQLELVTCDAHVTSHDFHEGLEAFEQRRSPMFLGR